MAVEMRNVIGAGLGEALPATLLFDYPTIDSLTDFVLARLTNEGTEAPTPSSPDRVGSIAGMSDEEVDRLIRARAKGRR